MDQQPIQTIQPEIQPQKPLSKTWQIVALAVAGVLVVGGVAAGSYYLWQKSSSNSNQTACTMEAKQCADGSYVGRTGPNCEFAPCPSVSASPSIVIDETADWQTYKNEKYGFEVRYPAGWVKEEQNNKIIFAEVAQSVKDNVIIAIQNNPNGLSARDFLINQGFDASLIKENVDLQSYKGIKVLPEGLCPGSSLYFVKGSSIISITACLNDRSIGDQILSTFKFTDDPTTGWQTYKNEQYGFEVKYPKETSRFLNKEWIYRENDIGVTFTVEGFIDDVWGIGVITKDGIEKSIGQDGNQFKDRKEKRENIIVDGRQAMMVTITTNQYEGWVSKTIFILDGDKYYRIGNGAVEDPNFELFYKSFHIIKK